VSRPRVVTLTADPGSKSGFSAWADGVLKFCDLVRLGTGRNPNGRLRGETMRRALTACGIEGPVGIKPLLLQSNAGVKVEFVTEGQFLGGGDPNRFAASAGVAEDARAWEVCADLIGIPLVSERVRPQTWRADFGLGARDIKRAKVTIKLVEFHSGALPASREDESINIAEAILLGLHRHRLMLQEAGMIGVAPRWHIRDLEQGSLQLEGDARRRRRRTGAKS